MIAIKRGFLIVASMIMLHLACVQAATIEKMIPVEVVSDPTVIRLDLQKEFNLKSKVQHVVGDCECLKLELDTATCVLKMTLNFKERYILPVKLLLFTEGSDDPNVANVYFVKSHDTQ